MRKITSQRIGKKNRFITGYAIYFQDEDGKTQQFTHYFGNHIPAYSSDTVVLSLKRKYDRRK